MTLFLNARSSNTQAATSQLELNPVVVAVKHLGNAVVEDLPLKQNNQNWLYGVPRSLQDGVLVRGIGSWDNHLAVFSSFPHFLSPLLAIVTNCVELDPEKLLRRVKLK